MEKLHLLGVAPKAKIRKVASSAEELQPSLAVSKNKSFVEAIKKDMGLVGKAVWVQLRLKETPSRVDQPRSCLVGRFVTAFDLLLDLIELRQYAIHLWSLKRGLKLSALGGALILFDFEDRSEEGRVLVRGSWSSKRFVLHLERWNPEIGCLQNGVAPKYG